MRHSGRVIVTRMLPTHRTPLHFFQPINILASFFCHHWTEKLNRGCTQMNADAPVLNRMSRRTHRRCADRLQYARMRIPGKGLRKRAGLRVASGWTDRAPAGGRGGAIPRRGCRTVYRRPVDRAGGGGRIEGGSGDRQCASRAVRERPQSQQLALVPAAAFWPPEAADPQSGLAAVRKLPLLRAATTPSAFLAFICGSI